MHGEPVTIEGSELLARAIQHETDHLDGVLFVDRLDTDDPQGGDEGDPRVGVVRSRAADGEGVAARDARTRLLMRVVFAGTPEVALPALDAIAASAHELVGVVTRPDAPAGRGRRLTPSPVAQRAEELGVPVLKPDHPRDPEFQEALRALARTAARWSRTARCCRSPRSTSRPTAGSTCTSRCCPHWRGAAPVQHALWAGDEVTGATTFRIVKELDAGPTFGVMTERIRPDDTAGSTCWSGWPRAAPGCSWPPSTVIEIGTLEAREQPEGGMSFAPKIPSRTRASTGPSRRSRSTAGSGPARPRPVPGRRTTASGSSSAR